MPSRRTFLKLSSGLLVPASVALTAPARADEGDERLFLVIWCNGGWDPLCTFAPLFGVDGVEHEAEAVAAEAHGVPYVSHPERPSVDTFFETWADRIAILNGFEVQSVAHPVATEKLFTGQSGARRDDWTTVIAGHTNRDLTAPSVVVSGPAFVDLFSSEVVRVGASGQLPALLTGDALSMSDLPVSGTPGASHVDAYVKARVAAAAEAAGSGRARVVAEGHALMLERIDELENYAELLDWGEGGDHDFQHELDIALTSLASGLSRCAALQYDGKWRLGWDTHSDLSLQSDHFQYLFEHLDWLMEQLSTRTDAGGTPLSERITVVVCSEMSRDPVVNREGGRDHWTWASALFMGAGVQGGRVHAGFGEGMEGLTVDLQSGQAAASGETLTSHHFGATLLAMADIDPGPWAGVDPVSAVFE